MFTILNRLRGTDNIFAYLNGILLGLLAYGLTLNSGLSLMVSGGYILGESMGWGKWIGGIITGYENVSDKEGTKNGIHFLANWIAPEKEDYTWYCMIALAIRGFYWGVLTILPLLLSDYIGYWTFIFVSFFIGITFPLSVVIGKYTAKKFQYEFGYFKMIGAWEHSEVWYGLAQDIALISLIFMI